MYGEAWTAPAKLAWEKLGRDKNGADNHQSQEMVRYRRIPDDILYDPAVQAAIAAVSALRVSDGPEQKGAKEKPEGDATERVAEATDPVPTKGSTPTSALAVAVIATTPPQAARSMSGAGADSDKTPPLHTIGDAVTSPYPLSLDRWLFTRPRLSPRQPQPRRR